MSLIRYTALRLVFAVPAFFGVLAVTFVLTHLLPANPAVVLAGPEASPEMIHRVEHQLGLDRSIPIQFWKYLGNLVHGDLGRSHFTGSTVIEDLTRRIPSTLELITVAICLAFGFGVGLAIISADRNRGIRGFVPRVIGTLGTSVPDYIFGVAFIVLFYTSLSWVPAPLGQTGSGGSIPRPTGAYLLDAIAAGDLGAIRSALAHLALPAVALALPIGSQIYRVARATIEEVFRSHYVDYAVMMGGARRYVWRTIGSNALPPILTMSGYFYSHLLGGALLIETVFSWGGIGQYAVNAILNNDYFAIQGFVVAVATFSILVYLAVDLVHAAVDPRVRSSF